MIKLPYLNEILFLCSEKIALMRSIYILLLLVLPTVLLAQRNKEASIQAHFSYGFQLPFGDLEEDFGNSNELNVGVDFLTSSNFIFGLDGSFFFGQTVKTDVLAPLRTAEGLIVGNDRNIAAIELRQRGFYVGGHIGKLFALSSSNPKSGIRATLGLGLLQHKIRIQDDPQRVVPQLTGDYKKGYDRLTNGLAIRPFLGYQHINPTTGFDFTAGITPIFGFTQNRRAINFDLGEGDDTQRLDILLGIKLAWTLNFSINSDASEIIYY